MYTDRLVKLLKGHRVFLQTHNFPDADAVASAFGLQQFLEYYGVSSTICYTGLIDKSCLNRIIEHCGIEIINADDIHDMSETDYIVTVDGQKFNSNFTDLIGYEVACIDHHPTFTKCHYKYKDIRLVGACSSIIASYYQHTQIPLNRRIATALLFGIRMDTCDLVRGARELDVEMVNFLYKYADNDFLAHLRQSNLELGDLKAYAAAIKNISVDNEIGFAKIPFECTDGLVAMISDFILSIDVVELSVVYAKRGSGLKFSVRSKSPKDFDAGKITSKALEGFGSGGGHSFMAGGFVPDASSIPQDNANLFIKDRFYSAISSLSNTKNDMIL